MIRAPRPVVLAVAAVVMVTACGSDPKQGYTAAPAYRQDVRTVAVPIFENTTFSHGLEFTLTDALIKEIHRSTPWRVVARDEAETTLTGSVTSSQLRRLSRQSESGLVQELAVDLTVSFEWKKNRTGEVLVARRGFRTADAFTPGRGAQERLDLGERAAIDRLARDIVGELRSSW